MRLIPLLLALGLIATSAGAQGAATPAPQAAAQPPTSDQGITQQLTDAQTDLRGAMPGPHGASLSDTQIKAKLAALPAVQARLEQVLAVLDPREEDVQARLAQLGPAPGAGQPPDSPATATIRRNLTHAYETVDGEVKQTKLLQVEAAQISARLVQLLHDNFSARLWTRSRSIADPGLWVDLASSFPADLNLLSRVVDREQTRLKEAVANRGRSALMVLGLLLGLVILGPARFLLGRIGIRRASAATGGRLRRSALAFWLVLVATLSLLLGGQVIRVALLGAGGLTVDFDDIVKLAIRAGVFAALLESLGRALLSPRRSGLRIAPLGDDVVDRVAAYPGLVGAAAGIATFVAGVNTVIGASLATSVASDCITLLIEMVAAGAALLALVQASQNRRAETSEAGNEPHLPWVIATACAWLALGGVLVSVLAGYLALATFLMRETVWIGAVLAALLVTIRFVDDLFPALLSDESATGRAVRRAIGLSESAMEQIAVLASGVFRLVLLGVAWAAILAPFGAGLGDVVSRIGEAQFELKIGQVEVSPGAILGGVGLFLIGLLITRAVRGWMEAAYLPKTNMDVGVRNSVATAVSYLGIIIASVLAFAYLGLSFTQIALFASALSVGIGFGLQAIIGNFVSGLILLAERPIKVGDWVAVGDLEGDVKAINIRATEIEMADHSRLIVPNSDFVTKTVRNVTHGGAVGRVRIVLRVDDSADPTEVRDVILGRLTGHSDVLSEPPPAVFMTDVRDGALEFTAFAYVASPRYAFRVKSELLFRIVPDLKARGIVLANSTPVVNVALGDRPIEPGAEARPATV